MKNRLVGILIVGIAALIGFVTYSFNRAMTQMVTISCGHGESCPMWGTIKFQTNMSISIIVAIVLLGLFFILKKEETRVVEKIIEKPTQIETKEISEENYKEVMENLLDDETELLKKIIAAKGTIFQSDLVDKTSFNKVKVTRILDKLEGKGIIERKRRGMTNVVILKH